MQLEIGMREDKKLNKLSKKLNTALKSVGALDEAMRTGNVAHKLSPLAFEVTKEAIKHPAVELLSDSINQFKELHGKDPVSIKVPPAILKSILSLMPDEDQKLFWVAPVKKLAGLDVDVSTDGTLILQ